MIAERSSIQSQSQDSQGESRLNNNKGDEDEEGVAGVGGGGGGGGNGNGNSINDDHNTHESNQVAIEKGTLLHTMDNTKKPHKSSHTNVLREATAVQSAQSNSPVKSFAHQSNFTNPTVDKARVVELISKSKGYKVSAPPFPLAV